MAATRFELHGEEGTFRELLRRLRFSANGGSVELVIKACTVVGDLDFRDKTYPHLHLTLVDSEVRGSLRLNNCELAHLVVESTTIDGSVFMAGAQIGKGPASTGDFTVASFNRSTIKNHFLVRHWHRDSQQPPTQHAHFYGDLDLHQLKVEGNLALRGAVIDGRLILSHATIGGSAVIRPWRPNEREDGTLLRTDIQNPATSSPNQTTIRQGIHGSGLQVHGTLDISGTRIEGSVNLEHCALGGLRGVVLEGNHPAAPNTPDPSSTEATEQQWIRTDETYPKESSPKLPNTTAFAGFVWLTDSGRDDVVPSYDSSLALPHERLHVTGVLSLHCATIRSDVKLYGAFIGGGIQASVASIGGNLELMAWRAPKHDAFATINKRTAPQHYDWKSYPSIVGEYATPDGHIKVSVYAPHITVGGSVRLCGSCFTSGVSFRAANIAGDFLLDSFRFSPTVLGVALGPDNRRYSIRLSAANIGTNVSFVGAILQGGITLENSEIRGDLIGQSLYRPHSSLADPTIDWRAKPHLARTQVGQGIWVKDESASLLLNGVNLRGDLDLRGVQLKGGILLQNAAVGGSVLLAPTFDHKAKLNKRSKIGDATDELRSQYSLQASGSSIGGDLDIRGAYFSSGVRLEGANIRASILANCCVKGNATSAFRTIIGEGKGAGLYSKEFETSDTKRAISARGLHVGGDVRFQGAILGSGVSLSNAKVGGSIQFEPFPVSNSKRKHTRIIYGERTTSTFGLRMPNIDVGGNVRLEEIVFDNTRTCIPKPRFELDLRSAHIRGRLSLEDVDPLPIEAPVLREIRPIFFDLRDVSARQLEMYCSVGEKSSHPHSINVAGWLSLGMVLLSSLILPSLGVALLNILVVPALAALFLVLIGVLGLEIRKELFRSGYRGAAVSDEKKCFQQWSQAAFLVEGLSHQNLTFRPLAEIKVDACIRFSVALAASPIVGLGFGRRSQASVSSAIAVCIALSLGLFFAADGAVIGATSPAYVAVVYAVSVLSALVFYWCHPRASAFIRQKTSEKELLNQLLMRRWFLARCEPQERAFGLVEEQLRLKGYHRPADAVSEHWHAIAAVLRNPLLRPLDMLVYALLGHGTRLGRAGVLVFLMLSIVSLVLSQEGNSVRSSAVLRREVQRLSILLEPAKSAYAVPAPSVRQFAVSDHAPSIEELRALQDLLLVQWVAAHLRRSSSADQILAVKARAHVRPSRIEAFRMTCYAFVPGAPWAGEWRPRPDQLVVRLPTLGGEVTSFRASITGEQLLSGVRAIGFIFFPLVLITILKYAPRLQTRRTERGNSI